MGDNNALKKYEKEMKMLIVKGGLAIEGIRRLLKGDKGENTKVYLVGGLKFCEESQRHICNHVREKIGNFPLTCHVLEILVESLDDNVLARLPSQEDIQETERTITNTVTYLLVQLLD